MSTITTPRLSPPEVTAVPVTRVLVAVLALLTAVAPLAIDMYLPAFPSMTTELGTSATGIQLTLTAFLVGLGIGQLFIGPVSDGIGRRTPLIVGSTVCLLATVLCAVAPSIEVLAGARLLQGLSGAAGVVLARAIITDAARGPAAAKLLSVLLIISVIAPVVAPLSGGAIVAAGGWRSVFWVQAGLVLVMIVGTLVHAKETLPRESRNRGGVTSTLHSARQLLGNRIYVGYVLTFCFSFAALFAYIAASPFVIQHIIGLSSTSFALLFALNAIAITITSAAAAGLAGRVDYRRMAAIGLSVASVAAIGLLVCVLTGVPTAPTLVLFGVFQGSLGFVFSNATTLALAESEAHAGTGSAFLGFLQFALAAVVAPLVGVAGEKTAVPMGLAMIMSIVLAVVAFVTLTRPLPNTASAGDPSAV